MSDFEANAENDLQCLRRYAEDDDQDAFRLLVERYSGLVYGTAMRRTRDRELANDITQNVFAALGAKASRLVKEKIPSVGAWLHRAATFESMHHIREQVAARRRDEIIREGISAMEPTSQGEWDEILPFLDEALEKLSSRDRDILFLHYFDRLKFVEIAERLGLRPATAQKRSVRALEKLSLLLRARGITVASATSLTAILTSELAEAAPPLLITKITTINAVAPGLPVSSSAFASMTLSKMFVIRIALVFAILTAVIFGIYAFANRSPKVQTELASDGLATFENSMGMTMIAVDPGSYTESSSDDGSLTQVTVDQGYYLASTEVTQAQWSAVMGGNPSNFIGDDLPVETVTWFDAMEFCEQLTLRDKEEGKLNEGFHYTLPTMIQWRHAHYCNSSVETTGELDEVAWHEGNSEQRTHAVATKKANAWGFYDMEGNVREWCLDDSGTPIPGQPEGRYFCGGSWKDNRRFENGVRGSAGGDFAARTRDHLGFRPAIVATE